MVQLIFPFNHKTCIFFQILLKFSSLLASDIYIYHFFLEHTEPMPIAIKMAQVQSHSLAIYEQVLMSAVIITCFVPLE